MPKPKSGFRRGPYQPPEGVKIEIKTEEAYRLLLKVSHWNGCARIAQWAEPQLRYAMSDQPYIGQVKRDGPATLLKKPKHFQISERLFDEIVRRQGEEGAHRWIASTLLWLAMIEARMMHAEKVEPDRFGPAIS